MLSSSIVLTLAAAAAAIDPVCGVYGELTPSPLCPDTLLLLVAGAAADVDVDDGPGIGELGNGLGPNALCEIPSPKLVAAPE